MFLMNNVSCEVRFACFPHYDHWRDKRQERDKEGKDLILPRVPVAMSATFWKASRNELVTMIVVLNDRKRKSLFVGKTDEQSGFDWILANSP